MTEKRVLTPAEEEVIQMRKDMAAGGRFEYRVKTYRKQNNSSIAEAIKAIAAKFPDDHKEFLIRSNAGLAGSLTERGE